MKKCIMTIAAGFALFAGQAVGEEVESREMMMSSGVICDEIQEVTDVLNAIDSGVDPQMAVFNVPGCGWIRGLLPATVTPIAPFETNQFIVMIGQMDFHTHDIGTQYGWIAFTEKQPDVEPVGQSL